jgi:hypothetical protein
MKTLIDYESLADFLLGYVCEVKGVLETIAFLMAQGYTKENLLVLGFNSDDIWTVLHN